MEVAQLPKETLLLDEETERQIREQIERARSQITEKKRFRSILKTFAKHGLLYLLRDSSFLSLFGKRRSREEEEFLRRVGYRLRLAFEELGPTFIKLGQVLVTRQELLPDAITGELAKLLDEVPPLPFSHLAIYLKDELPEGLDTFEWISDTPIGSGSLAQVYKAQLKDGRPCAVKIVRPTVDKLFKTDIKVIKRFVKRIQKRLPEEYVVSLDLTGLINDYYSSSMNELDMRKEAQTMAEHRPLIEEFEHLKMPQVYFSSMHVLITEYIDGWNLKEFPVDFLTFEERLERQLDLAHWYILMIAEGYYHADVHGSNIMIERHSKKTVIIDWGMAGRMDSVHAEALFRLLLHVRLNQIEDAAEAALDILHPTAFTDPIQLKDQLRSNLINYVNSEQGSDHNWGNLLLQLITIGVKNFCRIPNGLALWAKGFSAAEGTARWLCPEISFHYAVETSDVQVLRKFLSRRFNFRSNASFITEAAKLVSSFPRRMNKILDKLAWNDFKVPVEYNVSDRSIREAHRLVNRLILGIMASGFFVGSSLMIAFGGPSFQLVPKILMWAAVVVSVYVLWRIRRSKIV